MAVARAGLATQVHVIEGTRDIAVQCHRGATGIGAAGHEHLLHQECRAVTDAAFLALGGTVDFLAVAVHDACDDDGVVAHTVIDHSAVGIDQFHQVNIAGSQRECRFFLERRLDAHITGHTRDVVEAHFLSHAHSHAVDTLCEGRTQGHIGAREGAVGVGGPPGFHFARLIIPDHRVDVLVETSVTGHEAALHGCGIDKEFERRARLVLGAHLVILPRVEVHITHPRLDVAVARVHGNEAAVHEVQHVAHRVHRTHLHIQRVVLIVEQVHHVGLVHVVVDRVQVVGIAGQQLVVDRRVARLVLDKVGDGLVVLVEPAVLIAPMAAEVALHNLHLLADGLLGILLHPGVERGVNLQAVALQVEFEAFLVRNAFHLVGYSLAEVGRHTGIVGLEGVLQVDGQCRYRVILLLRQVAVLDHILQHLVATAQAVLGIDTRIVGACGLEQSHQHGTLLDFQVLGGGPEVGVGRRLDAVGIAAEVHRVGIHLQDFLLAVEDFQFGGDDPFLALHDEHLHAGDVAQQARRVVAAGAEHVLHQLLRDGARTARAAMQHQVLGRGAQAAEVDAVVAVETLVLGVDEHPEELGVD